MDTGLEIISNETFKRIQEFALLFPFTLLVPCVGLNVNIGRLKSDFGSCIFPISFNAQTQVVSVTYENYSPVDLLIVNYIVSGLIFVLGKLAM